LTTQYLHIMLHNVCIVFLDLASATTLQVARRAIIVPLVPRLGGWTMQNYSKTTHMKTESAEETLSHRAVK
jgi:hypothetical protein